jgi:predicted Zn-dependent protease
MQIEWQGFYLDGHTADRRLATIQLTHSALQITTGSGVTLWWPYEEIRQTQGFYVGEQVRLERGGEFPEVVMISDAAFLTALHRLVPGLKARFHDPAGRRMRAKLTLLAALATIVIAAALYIWGIPAIAELAASRVPISWEERLGQAVVNQLAPPDERCVEPTLTRMTDEIIKTLTAPLPELPYKFQLTVVKNPIANALAAPGGHIVVYQGLLEQTQSAEELAGVLAHELQHILKRHATRALLQHASTGLLMAALTGDVSGVLAFGVEGARTLGALRYSRISEEEADTEGMRMILAAGVDPAGMIVFFETMGQKKGEGTELLTYLSTHPSTQDRLKTLKSLAERPRKRPVKLLPAYNWRQITKICSAPARENKKG